MQSVEDCRIIDGKKFMWDGEDYESESFARENVSKYSEDGFETRLLEDEGQYRVYTRREAKELTVEGESN